MGFWKTALWPFFQGEKSAPGKPPGVSPPMPPMPSRSGPTGPVDTTTLVSLTPLVSNDARARIFGRFAYESEPLPSNEENIRVTDSWQKDNIIWVPIPQLKGIEGVERQTGKFPSPPGMLFHKIAAQQLIAMWNHWEQAGMLPLIKEFDGSYSPRFVRGSQSTLSNHAFGGAFDINYAWNHLGANPSPLGSHGSVRALVPIASQHGFFWGGNYSTRKDGMHFEVARVLP